MLTLDNLVYLYLDHKLSQNLTLHMPLKVSTKERNRVVDFNLSIMEDSLLRVWLREDTTVM